jgi:hypothetical protein
MEYVIRGASDDDIYKLAPIMRDLDREEVWASSALSPLEALQGCLQTSDEAFTALADGEPFCMFGVSPLTSLGSKAVPWLLTSQDIVQHQKQLLRYSKRIAYIWLDKYSILENYVDARHGPGLRWAKWVGFSISEEPYSFGPFQMPFYKIELRK